MVDYSEIPAGTVIICPKCGTKNQRTDNQCRKCDASLEEVESTLIAKLRVDVSKGVDESGKLLTIDEVKRRAEIAKAKGKCVVCGVKPDDQYAVPASAPCSFCGAPMCRGCMQSHKVDIKGPMLSHFQRFGLEYFSGVEDTALVWYSSYPEKFYVLLPGFYLCRNCMIYLHGPEFFRHTKDYYEKTGRMEELAELYENQGRLEDAKHARMSVRGMASKDLSQLIDKLREGGLAVPYRCPSCGANISIDKDSQAEGLKYCAYCGTAVNIDALVKAIESSLK